MSLSSQTKPAEFEIRTDDLSGPEIRELLMKHLRSLVEITPPGSMHTLNLNQLRQPDITIWSAWHKHKLVGCGALKELDAAHGEVKSMRTATAYLRKGVAAAVLGHIIAEAKRRGYCRLSLETSVSKPFKPAHGLYEKFGFIICPPFVGYHEDPNSVFMTLEL